MASTGAKKGGFALGKLVKLFGYTGFCVGIAEAFKMAKGFLPVRELLAAPTRLETPLVLVLLEIAFGAPLALLCPLLWLASAMLTASILYCSML